MLRIRRLLTAGLAAWDLFLDPQMVSAGHWTWLDTSPVLTGRSLCVTSSDGARRDNAPNTPGEGAKVSCARM